MSQGRIFGAQIGWVSAATIMTSVVLMAYGIQPLGMWICFAGILMFSIAACLRRESELAITALIISLIYVVVVSGLIMR